MGGSAGQAGSESSQGAGIRLDDLLERWGVFRESAESLAFPGWTTDEIHRAMNETAASEETYTTLKRVGEALGSREGTGPDDNPMLRMQRREARLEGRAAGRAQGRVEGRSETLARVVREILTGRGITVSAGMLDDQALLADVSEAAIIRTAYDCHSEADFVARIKRA